MGRIPLRSSAAPCFALVLLAFGCEEGTSPPPPSRVVSVANDEGNAAEEFCDVVPESARFGFPPLAGGTAPRPTGGARWLNVWATWCAPCVEEMPMLVEWGARLREDGVTVEQVFLSADATDEAVSSFRREHPGSPESLRVAEPNVIEPWVTTVGLDPGATLPLHVMADAEGRVRCARTGGLSEDHYDQVRSVLSTID